MALNSRLLGLNIAEATVEVSFRKESTFYDALYV